MKLMSLIVILVFSKNENVFSFQPFPRIVRSQCKFLPTEIEDLFPPGYFSRCDRARKKPEAVFLDSEASLCFALSFYGEKLCNKKFGNLKNLVSTETFTVKLCENVDIMRLEFNPNYEPDISNYNKLFKNSVTCGKVCFDVDDHVNPLCQAVRLAGTLHKLGDHALTIEDRDGVTKELSGQSTFQVNSKKEDSSASKVPKSDLKMETDLKIETDLKKETDIKMKTAVDAASLNRSSETDPIAKKVEESSHQDGSIKESDVSSAKHKYVKEVTGNTEPINIATHTDNSDTNSNVIATGENNSSPSFGNNDNLLKVSGKNASSKGNGERTDSDVSENFKNTLARNEPNKTGKSVSLSHAEENGNGYSNLTQNNGPKEVATQVSSLPKDKLTTEISNLQSPEITTKKSEDFTKTDVVKTNNKEISKTGDQKAYEAEHQNPSEASVKTDVPKTAEVEVEKPLEPDAEIEAKQLDRNEEGELIIDGNDFVPGTTINQETGSGPGNRVNLGSFPVGESADANSGGGNEMELTGFSSIENLRYGTPVRHEKFDDVDEDSHFFAYFMTMMVLCIVGYLIFHNKQKILALALEGRARRGRRRPNTSGYRKLDSNLEEAISSSRNISVTQVIY